MTVSVHDLRQKELELQTVRAELAEAHYLLGRSHYDAFDSERKRADRAEGELAELRGMLVHEEQAHDATGSLLARTEIKLKAAESKLEAATRAAWEILGVSSTVETPVHHSPSAVRFVETELGRSKAVADVVEAAQGLLVVLGNGEAAG